MERREKDRAQAGRKTPVDVEIDMETDRFGNCVISESGVYEMITVVAPEEDVVPPEEAA